MLEKVLENYKIDGNLENVDINSLGKTNITYVLTFLNKKKEDKYIVQKINTLFFPEPYKLMLNIEKITEYLKQEMKKNNDFNHKTLEIIKTKKDNLFCEIDGDYYRIYKFIGGMVSNSIKNKKMVYNVGKAYGYFQKLLINYPIDDLEDVASNYHNTPMRLNTFFNDLKVDSKKRAAEVTLEINFIKEREKVCFQIIEKLGRDIPVRIAHNDTKFNNVLLNETNDDFLAIVDLDTVMPSTILYDYGDGVRSCASNAKDDEIDLSKVYIDLDLFKSFTDGYMIQMANLLTDNELSLMAESIRIITLELSIRFLNDYINGDIFFKSKYEKHNLDRARNHIKLVCDIEKKMEYINNYIYESYNKHKK